MGVGGTQIEACTFWDYDDYRNRIAKEPYICPICGEIAHELPPNYIGEVFIQCSACEYHGRL